jgi:hypothetical protein
MSASRRRFLQLIAAGTAASVIAPAGALAVTTARKPAVKPRPVAPPKSEPVAPKTPSDAIAAEVEKQKGYVAEALKGIRAFTLPPGTEPAFVFTPVHARGRKSRSS